MPTIGFLGVITPAGQTHMVAAFVQRLRELGWIEGRTVAIEYRWAEGRNERFAEIAAEFVRLKVDAILTQGTQATTVAKQATSVIPIVATVVGDPVGSGLVASLALPGGNVTGLSVVSVDMAAKRLELLREAVPDFRHLAILFDVGNPVSVEEKRQVQAVCDEFALEAFPLAIRHTEDVVPAFEGHKDRAVPSCHRQPAHLEQCCSYQHLGGGRATTDELHFQVLRPGGRAPGLRTEFRAHLSTCRRFLRQDSSRDKTGRYPGRTADKIRTRYQSHNRESARPTNTGGTTRPRRRGDRITRRLCCTAHGRCWHFSAVPTAPSNVRFRGVHSTGQCNTSRSLSAGVSKPKVFRGR